MWPNGDWNAAALVQGGNEDADHCAIERDNTTKLLDSDSGMESGERSEQRRKRQREQNLLAQRRCRERHRNRVKNMEEVIERMGKELELALDENNRLKQMIQGSVAIVEEYERRWNNANKEREVLSQEKLELRRKLEETVEHLKRSSSFNDELESKLRLVTTAENIQRERGDVNNVSNKENVGDFMVKQEVSDSVAQSISLHDSACELLAAAAKEREADPSAEISSVLSDNMRRLVLHLISQFHQFLVDGNACSQVGVFSVLSSVEALKTQDSSTEKGQLPPCAAMLAQGPGQSGSVFQKAHAIARELGLTNTQREVVVHSWAAHSQTLGKLFEERKKFIMDVVVLQGTSPSATLVDFMSICTGMMMTNKGDAQIAAEKEAVSLTDFAHHACRVEEVINMLRENISKEQKQNFQFVTDILDGALTPHQICIICSSWGIGCPDMLAIARAITVQSMQCMPHLMKLPPG